MKEYIYSVKQDSKLKSVVQIMADGILSADKKFKEQYGMDAVKPAKGFYVSVQIKG